MEGKSDMWMDGVFCCCCYSSSMITHVSHMCNAYLPLLQCWTVEICVESNLKWSLTTNSNLSAYILLLLLNASLLRTLVWSTALAGPQVCSLLTCIQSSKCSFCYMRVASFLMIMNRKVNGDIKVNCISE